MSADPGPVPVATSTDGRLARRDRNRAAVLDAMLALFTEGDLDPAPEQVATRAGMGTAASLRQHLRASVGVSPSAYRRTFRGA